MSLKLSIGRAVYIIILVQCVVIHEGAKLFEVGLTILNTYLLAKVLPTKPVGI